MMVRSIVVGYLIGRGVVCGIREPIDLLFRRFALLAAIALMIN